MSLDYLVRVVTDLRARVDAMPSLRWATVTATAPTLSVVLDGEAAPLTRAVETLTHLAAGQRCIVLLWNRRGIVLGVPGGDPAGVIQATIAEQAPPGWLLCDGSTLPKASYPRLVKALGPKYAGAGNSFTLPDLRGRTLIGTGPAYPLGSIGGEATHLLSAAEMPAHTHRLSVNGRAHSYAWGADGNVGTDATAFTGSSTGNRLYTWQGGWNSTIGAGGSRPHNNMQPYAAINWIIRF